MNTRKLAGLGVALMALLLVLAPMALAQEGTATPEATATGSDTANSITVSDQDIVDGTITVDSVNIDAAGWVVIHADDSGAPGDVVGFAPVQAGANSNVVVEIDVAQATDTLYAMLHTDAGTVGTFEFPGPDAPVQVDGEAVIESFTVTGGLDVTPGVTTTATVSVTVGATASPTTAATSTTAPTVAATTEVTATATTTGTVGGTPETLPTTGGAPTPWSLVLLALGGLILLGGAGLALARRS